MPQEILTFSIFSEDIFIVHHELFFGWLNIFALRSRSNLTVINLPTISFAKMKALKEFLPVEVPVAVV